MWYVNCIARHYEKINCDTDPTVFHSTVYCSMHGHRTDSIQLTAFQCFQPPVPIHWTNLASHYENSEVNVLGQRSNEIEYFGGECMEVYVFEGNLWHIADVPVGNGVGF